MNVKANAAFASRSYKTCLPTLEDWEPSLDILDACHWAWHSQKLMA
jgi:hypothetical protein